VTSSATQSDCGDGNEASYDVENFALTDISIDVTAQIPGATLSTIVCVDNGTTVGDSGDAADPASLDITDLEPGIYTCTIVIDP
jgi:hypothetical protein